MSVIVNNFYQTLPATIAQGGIGVDSLTPSGLLFAGTTATNPVQSPGTPTSDEVYVSGGSSALGALTGKASISTLQWITTLTASSSPTIEFTNLTTVYSKYYFLCIAIVPDTANVSFNARFSTNNGSSYISSAGAYTSVGMGVREDNGSTTSNVNGSGTSIILMGSMATTANNANHCELNLVSPAVSLVDPACTFSSKCTNTNLYVRLKGFGCLQSTTGAINAIQFFMSSGNISTGKIALFGVLA